MPLPNQLPDVTQELISTPSSRTHHYGLDGSTRLVSIADLDNITIPPLDDSQHQRVVSYEKRIANGEDPTYGNSFPHLLLVVPDGATEATLVNARDQFELLTAYRLAAVTTARCKLFWPTFTFRSWVRVVNFERSLRHEPPLDLPL